MRSLTGDIDLPPIADSSSGGATLANLEDQCNRDQGISTEGEDHVDDSGTTCETTEPVQHDLIAEMSWLAVELARSAAPSNPERALGWTDRGLAYHPIDPNMDPANEYELLELKATLLAQLGRGSEASEVHAQILRDASTDYRLTLACLADEYKVERNWYGHDLASVWVWRRALLRDADDAITGGDLDRARTRIVQLGEFSAAKFRPDWNGELTTVVDRLARVGGDAGSSVYSAYMSLDRLTREVLPWVVGAVGGQSLARTISALSPVTCLAEATTSGSGVSTTAAVWTRYPQAHPVRKRLDEFLDTVEYRGNPMSLSEVNRLTAVALDRIGISLGSEVEDMTGANLVWPRRLAASSIEWMTMWAAIRAEWTTSHHLGEHGDDPLKDRSAGWETPWEAGWRIISGDLFRVINSTVTRILASPLDMPPDAAVRMLFTPVSLARDGKSRCRVGAG